MDGTVITNTDPDDHQCIKKNLPNSYMQWNILENTVEM